ncbi:MAG: ubiquinone/menaquinone biosynthesis methyltransferase [Acidimicrobiales bacterium]
MRGRVAISLLRVSPPSGGPEALPRGDEKARAVRAMFDTIAPRYDLVNRLMTFGLDRHWRRLAVRVLALRPGATVLDVACGTGDLCRDLASAGFRPVGIDMSSGMLSHARAEAPLVQGDALALPFSNDSFDGAVSGFALRNLVGLEPLFAELARVLRPGARVALLDVDSPTNPLLHAGHQVYFGRVVPLIGAALSDGAAYRYLPKSVAYLPAPAELLEQLRRAGFESVARRRLTGGITQLITGTRRS